MWRCVAVQQPSGSLLVIRSSQLLPRPAPRTAALAHELLERMARTGDSFRGGVEPMREGVAGGHRAHELLARCSVFGCAAGYGCWWRGDRVPHRDELLLEGDFGVQNVSPELDDLRPRFHAKNQVHSGKVDALLGQRARFVEAPCVDLSAQGNSSVLATRDCRARFRIPRIQELPAERIAVVTREPLSANLDEPPAGFIAQVDYAPKLQVRKELKN